MLSLDVEFFHIIEIMLVVWRLQILSKKMSKRFAIGILHGKTNYNAGQTKILTCISIECSRFFFVQNVSFPTSIFIY